MANEFLFTPETDGSVRSKLVGYAQSAGLLISNWIQNALGLQLVETIVPTVRTFTNVAAQYARAFASLDTATDPGDVDPYDPTNQTLPWAPGGLSDKGSNEFGTNRITAAFATSTVRFFNNGTGAVSQTFAPYALTFQRNYPDPVTGLAPTYRNALPGVPSYTTIDGSGNVIGTLAANPDHTLTVGPNVNVLLPIVAEVQGRAGSAGSGTITIQGNALPGVTVTNPSQVIGVDLEPAPDYRERCRTAPAAVSPNGPAQAYEYIAKGAQKDAAGNIYYFPTGSSTALGIDSSGNLTSFPNATGGVSYGVTGVYVSKSSTTGNVTVYVRGASGGAGMSTAATDIGNLLDAVYAPDCTSRTVLAAIDVAVTLAGAIRAKPGPGVTTASVAANVGAALAAFFPTVPLGGFNQTAGAGTLYLNNLIAVVLKADPAIYEFVPSSPGGDTALALGHDATLTNSITSGSVTLA